jgi:hypothetical protein
MPEWSYSLPATACITGSRLHKVPGSVCSQCYARKGNYRFNNVRTAQNRRLLSLQDPRWVEAMSLLINKRCKEVFRWHDAGDLQSPEHLQIILEVARRTPGIRHWLPTKEKVWVSALKPRDIPDNLVIRLSSPMIDKSAKPTVNYVVASVYTDTGNPRKGQRVCPATEAHRFEDQKCGDCRDCWDRNIKEVLYRKH